MPQFQPPPFQPPQRPSQQEPHTVYPQWQQPSQQWYPPSPQVYEYPIQQGKPPLPPQRPLPKRRDWLWAMLALTALGVVGLLLVHLLGGVTLPGTSTPHNAGMTAYQYKDSTTSETVANLDKEGNSLAGTDVNVAATILNFVKDSNGNTTAANVTDAENFEEVIQVDFPAGTDVSQLNLQDQIVVWGTDEGTATGTNAFGAMVHEVWIEVLYLTDQTTGYSE